MFVIIATTIIHHLAASLTCWVRARRRSKVMSNLATVQSWLSQCRMLWVIPPCTWISPTGRRRGRADIALALLKNNPPQTDSISW